MRSFGVRARRKGGQLREVVVIVFKSTVVYVATHFRKGGWVSGAQHVLQPSLNLMVCKRAATTHLSDSALYASKTIFQGFYIPKDGVNSKQASPNKIARFGGPRLRVCELRSGEGCDRDYAPLEGYCRCIPQNGAYRLGNGHPSPPRRLVPW